MGPGHDQPVDKSLKEYLTLDVRYVDGRGVNARGQAPAGPAHERNSPKVRPTFERRTLNPID
jgi:hypothetical protein